MAQAKYRAPHGTRDWLPDRVGVYRRIEQAVRETCTRYGYHEIRTPSFESLELFARGIGETTDIVEKQMFTFSTSGDGATYALRPEMTASTVRAYLEHALYKTGGLAKFFYFGPAFRHERAQRGRLREFTQFGVEAFGSHDPRLDAETARLFADIAEALGVPQVALRIHTIGCAQCRPAYRDALRAFATARAAAFCEHCRRRLDRNPLRILDCKEERCVEVSREAPRMGAHLCTACRGHFNEFRRALERSGLPATVDDRLVRGLDYYTRTVYEFTAGGLGAQDAIAGGGRYDGLVEELGGPPTGAVGFAAGVDRIALLLEPPPPAALHVYVVCVAPELQDEVPGVLHALRAAGMRADTDYLNRSVRGQMRDANHRGARFAVVLGPDEWARGRVKVRDMTGQTEEEVEAGRLAEYLSARCT
jgi:histidyl-tRNA synthetase